MVLGRTFLASEQKRNTSDSKRFALERQGKAEPMAVFAFARTAEEDRRKCRSPLSSMLSHASSLSPYLRFRYKKENRKVSFTCYNKMYNFQLIFSALGR